MFDDLTPATPIASAPSASPLEINQFNPYQSGPSETYGQVSVSQPVAEASGRGIVKLLAFLLILLVLGVVSTVTITQVLTTQVYRSTKGVLLSSPLHSTVWQSFGSVSEAEVELPIITPKGLIKHSFLLDTGAVVSSLPREMAETLGFNLAFLPRQTFKGFGNTTSFAYSAEMNVQMGGQNLIMPVVFTESEGSKSLLGRKGLFDKFTIVVDHKSQVVEIRE